MPVYEYDQPDRFVAGTVGEPGQRTFFLQASAAGRVTSVALEKTQVAVLAERVDELLDDVVRRSGGEAAVPAIAGNAMMAMAEQERNQMAFRRAGSSLMADKVGNSTRTMTELIWNSTEPVICDAKP